MVQSSATNSKEIIIHVTKFLIADSQAVYFGCFKTQIWNLERTTYRTTHSRASFSMTLYWFM